MSAPALAAIRAGLDRVTATGRRLPVWWRDDDAVRETPELGRLLRLSRSFGIPVAVAAIPAFVEPSLVERMGAEPGARVLVHGWRHANHAPSGVKSAEFGPHRALAEMASELRRGRKSIRAAFGDQALDVFVPPWNRIAPEAAALLAEAGYRGLSTFGFPRSSPAIDTHIDPIDWRGTRGLAAPERIAARFTRDLSGWLESGSEEPFGVLTHHLVMDDATWSFCAALFEIILSHPSVMTPELDRLWRIGQSA